MESFNEGRIAIHLILLALCVCIQIHVSFDSKQASASSESLLLSNITGPTLADHNLKVDLVANGLKFPTSMAFLAPDDILVLEKDEGTVRRIVNGTLFMEPLHEVRVSTGGERGMLGIAITKQDNLNSTLVFLYFSSPDTGSFDNMLVRYELANNKLIHPNILLDIPNAYSRLHNGGVVTVGPDGNVYLLVGDTKGPDPQIGEDINGRAGVLRVTIDGDAVNGNIIMGDPKQRSLYFAYGIRNGFGMDFDPVTGNLWDTENGAAFHDEINLVKPGFNSGWQHVQGMAIKQRSFDSSKIVNFGGKAAYSDPEFVWIPPVGLTAIKFLSSEKLGRQYENDLFVADINNGNLYHFDLGHNRTQLQLNGSLADKIANTRVQSYSSEIVFGQGFGGITDLEVGPDGYLYVVSYGTGAIYRIAPK